jgi:thioredoxin 1
MSNKQIIKHISNKDDFLYLLQNNPGLILLKFGATWCNPCKVIDPVIYEFFNNTPEKVICVSLDVDENFELYGYMKKSRVTNGIPVILCYAVGNVNVMPTDSVTGANSVAVNQFLNRTVERINLLYKDKL